MKAGHKSGHLIRHSPTVPAFLAQLSYMECFLWERGMKQFEQDIELVVKNLCTIKAIGGKSEWLRSATVVLVRLWNDEIFLRPVVTCWTAGQQVKQSILHLGHDSN